MELFEEIRREYTHGTGTIQGVSRKLGVHRRMVRQALGCATPPEWKPAVRERPSLGPVTDFIDGILTADERAPKKQRHTAWRIWQRICEERPQVSVGRVAPVSLILPNYDEGAPATKYEPPETGATRQTDR